MRYITEMQLSPIRTAILSKRFAKMRQIAFSSPTNRNTADNKFMKNQVLLSYP